MHKGSASKLELASFTFASNFLSTFVTDLIYNVVKIQFFQPHIMTVLKNTQVGEISHPSSNYEISLVVHPFGSMNDITNLFRFISNPSSNSGAYGDKNPWLGLKQGTLDMMLSIGTTKGNHVRFADKSLELDENNKVCMRIIIPFHRM